MACVDELHVNDVGTSIEVAITECNPDGSSSVVDISGASSLVIRFQKAGTTKITVDKSAVVYTEGTNGDGTDGILQYITESDFLNVPGTWKAQGIITYPNGSTFHSAVIQQIQVGTNLATPQ